MTRSSCACARPSGGQQNGERRESREGKIYDHHETKCMTIACSSHERGEITLQKESHCCTCNRGSSSAFLTAATAPSPTHSSSHLKISWCHLSELPPFRTLNRELAKESEKSAIGLSTETRTRYESHQWFSFSKYKNLEGTPRRWRAVKAEIPCDSPNPDTMNSRSVSDGGTAESWLETWD